MSTAAATASDRAAQPDPTRAWARASATLNAVAVLITLVFTLIQHGKTLALAFRNQAPQPGHSLTGRFVGTAVIHIIGKCMRRGAMRGLALYIAPVRPRAARPTLPHTSLDFPITAESTGASRDDHVVPIARLGVSLTQVTAEVDRCKAPAARVESPRFDAGPEHRRRNCLLAEEQLRILPPPQQKSAECSSPEAEPCAASRKGPVRKQSRDPVSNAANGDSDSSQNSIQLFPDRPKASDQTEAAPALRWPVSPAREVAAPASR